MKKSIFFTCILLTNLFITTNDTIPTPEIQDQDDNRLTKNQATENLVLKILQDENERLTQVIYNQENSKFFVQSCIFAIGLITGLLLGVIIHLQLKIDHTNNTFKQLTDFMKHVTEIRNNNIK